MYLIIPSLLPLFVHFFVLPSLLFCFMLVHADLSQVDNIHWSINGGVHYYSFVVFLSCSDT